MQLVILISVCLLLLWLALERRRGNFRPVYSLKLQTVWTVLMLLLAVSLSMYPKKQALALEQVVLEHSVVQSETEMLTIQGLFHSIKCSRLQHVPAVKAVCEMVPPHCTTQFGTTKLKISWC